MTDDKAEVNKNSGDDDARENTFNAVIPYSDASELRPNNDENENNKDDVGNVASIFPNEVNSRGIIGRKWFND